MREKIAKAICYADEQNGGPPWEYIEQLGKHAINAYYDRADAVLDALMEPDAAMMRAGADASPMWQTDSPDTYAIAVHDVADIFTAMIKAAKEGG